MGILNFFRKKESKASKLNRMLIESQSNTDVEIKENYVKISREGYKTNPYVYRAIKMIADSVADLDFTLCQTVKNQEREIERSPYLDLLNNPNEMQGKSEFLREFVSTLLLSGEGFMEGIYGGGKPQFLYSRRPDRIKLELGDYKKVIKNYIFKVNGREMKIEEKHMSFIKYFNPVDDWRGMSPITAASLSVDLSNEWKKWNVGFLMNGARPSLAIKLQQDVEITSKMKEQLKEQFIQNNTGAYNVGKPLLLTGGADVTEVGSKPADMDGLEGQQLTAKEIGLIYGIDPILMGDTSSSTYNNKEEAKKDFYTDVVFLVMQLIVDELNRWLTPSYGDNLKLSFSRIIPALAKDMKDIAEVYGKAWEQGAITRNEYREKLKLNEIAEGDVFKTKIQDIFIEASVKTKTKSIKVEKNSIETVLNKMNQYIEYKQTSQESILKVSESIKEDEIYKDVLPVYTLEVAEVGANSLLGIDEGFSFDAFSTNTEKYLKEEVGKKIKYISDTLREKVVKEIEDGVKNNIGTFKIKENIKKVYGEQYFAATDSHLQTIVRTETMDALTFATDEAFRQSGVVGGKEWVTTIDGRERATHGELDGQIVGIDKQFVIPSTGEKSYRPHGFNSAGENISCRCINSAVVGEKSLLDNYEKKKAYWESKNNEAISYEATFTKAYKKAFKKQEENTLNAFDNIEV